MSKTCNTCKTCKPCKTCKMRRNKAVLIFTIFVMIIMSTAPVVVGAATNSIVLSVEQSYPVTAFPENETFIYRLRPIETGSPMPRGRAVEGYTILISGNSIVEIGPIYYDEHGLYQYELFQVVEAEKPGYVYDRQVYLLEVYVSRAMNANVVVLNGKYEKVQGIVFQNFSENGNEPKPTDRPEPPTTRPEPPTTRPEPPTTRPGSTHRPIDPLTPQITPEPTAIPEPTATPRSSERQREYRTPRPIAPNQPETLESLEMPEIDDYFLIGDEDGPSGGTKVNGNTTAQQANNPRQGIYGPKTGDDSDMAFSITIFGLGGLLMAVAVIFLIFGGKRKRRDS